MSVHRSIRLDEAIADRVTALQRDGESITSVYTRVIEAGVVALESPPADDATESAGASSAPGEVAALREAVAALTDQLKQQGEQLTAAMSQNAELTTALKNEQETARGVLAIQGLAKVRELSSPVDTETPKRRGLLRRLFGRWGSDDTEN